MTTVTRQVPVSVNRWTRRITNLWRTFFASGDMTILLIAFALVTIPAWSLKAAGWPLAMNTLLPVLGLSVLLGFMLARSHHNELFALILSMIYGLVAILIVAAINEPGGFFEGLGSVFDHIAKWAAAAVGGGINQDDLVFTMLISGLFWFLGYNAVWHIFRVDRVWRVILPPGLILVTNSVYYTGEVSLNTYLILFIFLSLLLIIRSNLDAREWEWYVNGIRVPRRVRAQFFRLGTILALLALLLAWGLPSGDLQDRLDRFQQFLRSEPLTQLSELWNRLFASADTEGPTTTDYYGGDTLQLGGAIRLGDQTVFLVSAPPGRRYYWRSRVFDSYDGGGRWSPRADTRLTDGEAPLEISYDPYNNTSRVPVQQTFTMALSASRLIYAAPQPEQVDLATKTDLRYAPEPDQTMNVSVIRPLKLLYQGDTYTVTSLMSNATASELHTATTDYPQWIRDLYLGPLSPSIGQDTVNLAQQIVTDAGATTAYDQAKAVETWLRTNIVYNETISQPPDGVDPIEWVLFTEKQGYCNYYASAMVVMLHSLGIPARLAAGFAQGTWDDSQQAFNVRERDAHTWVEAFFPGYGWIEFEPTAAQAPINRGDETPPQATPVVTPTSTPSPTPLPSATPAAPPLMTQQDNRPLPTATPTFTPSPTPTPIIVPTQPPPIRPQPAGPFSFLLKALGLILAILLVIVLLVIIGVLIFWWWEWRGMKGLSPVARAYARLERYISLIGLKLSAQQTPDERRRHIVKRLPAAEPPVTAITQLYTKERYGPGLKAPTDDLAQAQMADAAWSDARGSILKRWLRRRLPWGK